MSRLTGIASASLKSKLVEIIRLRGSMSISDYMKIVLTNPESGFYMNNDVFGVKGHFTTSPEISQVFGEVLGAWILNEWRRFDCPKPLRLVEFGPGRGTLMSDILRVFSKFSETHDNTLVHFIEMSKHLEKVQRDTILNRKFNIENVSWHTSIDSFDKKPDGFTAFVAHEYLDALPIHKFIRNPKSGSWQEVFIDYNERNDLRFCLAKGPSLASQLLVPQDFNGDHIEVCPQAALQLEKVSQRLNESGSGCMLICDYGFEDEAEPSPVDSTGVASARPAKHNRDTFRAFKNHISVDPLQDPGEADLTADVDFGYLKNHLKDKALIFGPVNQRDFLLRCGLQLRLKVLLEEASESEREYLMSGANMLIEDMGHRYKFLSIFPKSRASLFDGDPPAGF